MGKFSCHLNNGREGLRHLFRSLHSLEATLQPLLEPAKAQRLQPHAPLPASRSRQALPQELSMLLYSFASLRIRPQPHILDLVLRAAADVDEQMCSQVGRHAPTDASRCL